MTTATLIPGENLESVFEKTPLMQPAKRFSREQQTITKTSAPASTLFLLARFHLVLPVAAEGRLQVTSPIQNGKSNGAANLLRS